MSQTNDETSKKLDSYAIKLISRRPRSLQEFKNKLHAFAEKHRVPPQTTDRVIKKFQNQGVLDDEQFVVWWKTQRDMFRPRGKTVIYQELLRRGVKKETIDSVFGQESDKKISESEYEHALSVAEKKMRTGKETNGGKKMEKIRAALLRRGFSWETAARAVDALRKKDYNTNQR